MELFAKESFGGIFFFFNSEGLVYFSVCMFFFFPFFSLQQFTFWLQREKERGKTSFKSEADLN